MMQTTLKGVTVLDLTRMLPGPFCSMLLADLGAEVIKVESHMLGDLMRSAPPLVGGESCYFMSVNRNKKSLALNLKRKEGREIFLRLAAKADVIIEGFQPGQAERMGIAYADIQALNPDIIYCSISGYGQDGPYRERAGHNINYVALSGMLDLVQGPGQTPTIPAVQTADIGGALYATIAILAAVVARNARGEGMHLDASLFHAVISMMTFSAATLISAETRFERRQRHLSGQFPCYNLYRTKDGKYMALGALESVWWGDFCTAIGRQDLVSKQFPAEDERQSVLADVQSVFAQRTQAQWVAFFADKNVCCEPVSTLDKALALPVVRERGMICEVDHPTAGRLSQIGFPVRGPTSNVGRGVPESPACASPAPLLGQHTIEILRSLGYDDESIQELRKARVVATPEEASRKVEL